VSAGSSRVQAWIDSRGHRWAARVNSRTSGQGCPYCAGKRALVGVNDLATTHPELAAEALNWDPSAVKAGSNKTLRWRCNHGHVWTATPNNRSKGSGCSVCSGHVIVPGINDLATTHPDVVQQADGWDPTAISAGSHRRLAWRCSAGHRWTGVVADRVRSHGCPTCSGRRVLPGFNDLATTHPELTSEADGWDPTTLSAGSSKVMSWRCSVGHTWRARVSHRARGTGCPTCANKKVIPGFNDLATTHPELAAEADGWDPTSLSAGSGKNPWRCVEGHTWIARVGSRAGEGVGCPVCAGRKVLVEVNDLATTHPDVAREADGWDPSTVVAGSNERRAWQCSRGHSWEARVFSRTRDGRGCPYCSGRLLIRGVNDLLTLYPDVAAQLVDVDPSSVHAGSKRRVTWQCDQGHTWQALVATRTRKNPSGCPGCTPGGGFDVTKPGWLYLVEHEGWGLLQIGFSNRPDGRLALHKSRSRTVLDLFGPTDGVTTRAWEQDILVLPKAHGALVSPKEIAGTFDGYTESWVKVSHPARSLHELMDEVIAGAEDDGSLS
jgi:hypothetical protein